MQTAKPKEFVELLDALMYARTGPWIALYRSSGNLEIYNFDSRKFLYEDDLGQQQPTSIAAMYGSIYVTHKTELLHYRRDREGSWIKSSHPQTVESNKHQIVAFDNTMLLYKIKHSTVTIYYYPEEPERIPKYWVDGEIEKCQPGDDGKFLVAYKDWHGVRNIVYVTIDHNCHLKEKKLWSNLDQWRDYDLLYISFHVLVFSKDNLLQTVPCEWDFYFVPKELDYGSFLLQGFWGLLNYPPTCETVRIYPARDVGKPIEIQLPAKEAYFYYGNLIVFASDGRSSEIHVVKRKLGCPEGYDILRFPEGSTEISNLQLDEDRGALYGLVKDTTDKTSVFRLDISSYVSVARDPGREPWDLEEKDEEAEGWHKPINDEGIDKGAIQKLLEKGSRHVNDWVSKSPL